MLSSAIRRTKTGFRVWGTRFETDSHYIEVVIQKIQGSIKLGNALHSRELYRPWYGLDTSNSGRTANIEQISSGLSMLDGFGRQSLFIGVERNTGAFLQ